MAGNSKACYTVISYEENLKFFNTTVQKEIEFWQSQNVSGIAVGLHHKEIDDKNHEHFMMGYSKSAPSLSEFIDIIKSRNAELQASAKASGKDLSIVLESGEVVDRALYKIYTGRYAKKHCVYDPKALENYLSHSTAASRRENKVQYDPDADVIYSDGFDLDSYLSRDAVAKAKAESREDDVDIFSEISDIIDVRRIRHFPELVWYLKKKQLRSLLQFCIAHPSVVVSYISDMRNFVIGSFSDNATYSEDEKPYKPESEPVKMTYSESQAVLARSTDEVFGGSPAEASPSDELSVETTPASAEETAPESEESLSGIPAESGSAKLLESECEASLSGIPAESGSAKLPDSEESCFSGSTLADSSAYFLTEEDFEEIDISPFD